MNEEATTRLVGIQQGHWEHAGLTTMERAAPMQASIEVLYTDNLQLPPRRINDALLSTTPLNNPAFCRQHHHHAHHQDLQQEHPVDAIFVMIPGNPGVPHFYKSFMRILHCELAEQRQRKDSANAASKDGRSFPRNLAILSVSYLGHALPNLTQDDVFTLQDQVEVVSAFLQKFVFPLRQRLEDERAKRKNVAHHQQSSVVSAKSSGASCCAACTCKDNNAQKTINVYVAGHSIGGFVAAHMLARFKHDIRQGFLLTPTVHNMAQTPNGRQNSKYLFFPLAIEGFAKLVSILTYFPVSARKVILDHAHPQMEDDDHYTVLQMGKKNLVRNILYMARTEFIQLDKLDKHLLKWSCEACRNCCAACSGDAPAFPRSVLYYVRHDGWVPTNDRLDVVAALSDEVKRGAAAWVLDDDCEVAHAWCLQHNEAVIRNGILPFWA